MPVVDCDVEVARDRLEAAGATIEPGNTEHERWRATLGAATAVAYDDKVVIQGSDPHAIDAVIRNESGRVHLYFDGAARGNPGPSAVGWVLVSDNGVIAEDGSRIGRSTNNQAEYKALIRGLQAAQNYGFDEIHIRSDSELLVNQLRGEWKTNDPTLRELRVTANELLASFDDWVITHVPRELNERADELANDALDTQ